jgi:iron-sulfur cluster assembly accessory protein
MISLTETAAEKVRKLAAGDADARVLRLSVEGGGCPGFQYAVGCDTAAEDDDLQWESNGVTIVVDRISLPYLDGSTVDYSDRLLGAGSGSATPTWRRAAAATPPSRPRRASRARSSQAGDGCG